ncbi:MAG: PSD1 and planctomycete cytochrome C domain-containing protein [Acidobacteria bacterium]|nr:PSD1 and planctomycete cytochrome C domain-containing protein [Acidobacteriota bacterium]
MRSARPSVLFGVTLAAVLGLTATAGAQNEPINFTDHIRPIMERACWNCHGEAAQLSDLDLSSREGALEGGTKGPAIVPGRAEDSRLFRMVAGLDQPFMPMSGDALSDAELAAVRTWIDDGAHWDTGEVTAAADALAALENDELPPGARDYWAFRHPQQAPVPASREFDHPVDRFLEASRKNAGLTAAPPADRLTLLRRAYLDLIGLPPTPEQVEEFLADTERGAWERLIDKLLDSPHYGERWGRHWLDVARYADTDGFEQDYVRLNMWRYRDYVIDAFNDDKPYNQFLREQIAGDELDYVTDETRIATGFLRSGPRVNFREKDNPERRHDYLDDMLATVGRGVLGMTVHCARCHDHKFDPILQKDYYSMQASIYGYVEIDYPLLDRDEADVYFAAMRDVDDRQQPLRDEVDAIETPYREELRAEMIRERFPENVQAAAFKPEAERTPGEQLLATQVLTINPPRAQVAAALTPEDKARVDELNAQIAALEDERPPTPAMAHIVTDGDYRFAPDGPGDQVIGCPECRTPPEVDGTYLYEEGGPAYKAPPNYFLIRGDPFSPGSPMSPGFLTAATYGDPPTEIPRPDGRTSGRRLALAEWIASRDNPLTARVMVNRIWHHHFGRGIVRTLDNLGRMGDTPTHPELLDWLAVEFMDRGWSIKEMHRLLTTSEAYRMAASFPHEASEDADPENNLLWRYRGQRLEAEILRDAIMTVSGGIDLTVGGPAIFPHIPSDILFQSDGKGFWCGSPPPGRRITAPSTGIWCEEPDRPEVWRRSVYVFRRRSLGFPFFDTFDLPDQNQTAAARNVSTVSTQALTLMNNPFVLNQAELFAQRLEREAPGDLDAQIDLAYLIALTRKPTDMEREVARGLATEQSLVDFTHVMMNLNEFLYLR